MTRLLGIDEALARVLEHVRPLALEEVAVGGAAGRVLAADVAAAVSLPPFRSSAMDGYAVRSRDLPATLTVVDSSAAGRPATVALGPGQAIEISTGATVPDDADAVVPIERVVVGDAGVTVAAAVPSGANVREPGRDVRAGDLVVPAGTVLRAAHLGAIAAAGRASVTCARQPRVVVAPTGNELRPPGSELRSGEIYESNGLLIAAQAASAGALTSELPPVADDPQATRTALAAALEADVVITSGGVSVGPHDLVRAALEELGAEEVFWRVAVKPGKPVAFLRRGATLVFGLPGNPVSSLVDFELFVRPALRALQGAPPGPHYLPGRLALPARRDLEREQLVRARLEVGQDGIVVSPLGAQESHMIVRSAAADALVRIDRGEGELASGATVRYLPIL